MATFLQFAVVTQRDAERARQEARVLARTVGFSRADTEAVALATRELATNLVRYAAGGRLTISMLAANAVAGIEVESQDDGPGIASIDRAMEDGYSTGGGLGSGLPGVRRLMDDFEIRSGPEGTRVTARKWLRAR